MIFLGEKVVVPQQLQALEKKLLNENNFNLLASDMIGFSRSLKDYRNAECTLKKYPQKLPTASVVISFNNEQRSTLLRTVWSVINRSPKELISEIILVDDASDNDFLQNTLATYVKGLPIKTLVVQSAKRIGHVRARLYGVRKATVCIILHFTLF